MTDTNAQKREALVRRIRALFAKTVEHGATEHEAMAAAALADRLMQQHDLTYEDVETEVRAEKYGNRARPFTMGGPHRRRRHEVAYCVTRIGQFWDCKAWYREGRDLVFFGSATDTELAHLMVDLIRLAMDHECAGYLKKATFPGGLHGRTLRASFMLGMGVRICERLAEIKAARVAAAKPPLSPDGSVPQHRALVVVRQEVVQQKWDQFFEESGLGKTWKKPPKKKYRYASTAAYHSGAAAGDRVDLSGNKLGQQGLIEGRQQ